MFRSAGRGAARGRDAAGRRADCRDRLAVRCAPGERAGRPGHAVHGRFRRTGKAPFDSSRGDLQPHALLHRQGAGTRDHVRIVEGLRKGPQCRLEDGKPQGQRRPHSAGARPAVFRAHERQDRHGGGHGHRDTGAREARGVLAADPHQRERSRGHRARARRRSRRWTIWPARRCSSARGAFTPTAWPA